MAAARVLGCKRLTLFGLEGNADHLRLLASAGLSQAEEQRWRAAGEGRELREHLAPRDASGLTLLPLRSGSQLVGALGIDHATSRSRTSAERTLSRRD